MYVVCLFVCSRGDTVCHGGLRTRKLGQSPIAIRPIVSEVCSQGRNHRQIAQHYNLVFEHYPCHESTIEMRIRSGLFIKEQKSYDVKPYRGLAAEAQLHGNNGPRESYWSHTTQLSCQMLPRTDAVPQFIHRWRCRLFLRKGPAQTECAI